MGSACLSADDACSVPQCEADEASSLSLQNDKTRSRDGSPAVVLFVVILFGAVEWLDRRGKSHKKPPRKWLRPLGAIARTATYCGIGFAIWMVYPQPKDIFEVPLAEVPLGDILRTFFYALIFFGLAAFYVRLTPNWDDDDAWERWESYGLLGGFVATGVAIHYLSRALI